MEKKRRGLHAADLCMPAPGAPGAWGILFGSMVWLKGELGQHYGFLFPLNQDLEKWFYLYISIQTTSGIELYFEWQWWLNVGYQWTHKSVVTLRYFSRDLQMPWFKVYLVGGFAVSTPLKNMKVGWDDDYSQYIWNIKAMFQTTNQWLWTIMNHY